MGTAKADKRLLDVIDGVVLTGQTALVRRRGRRVRISLEAVKSTSPRKPFRWPEQHPEWIVGDVDDLVSVDWSQYWRP